MSQSKTARQSVLHPIFDSLDFIKSQTLLPVYQDFPEAQPDFQQTRAFLLSYQGNAATFQAYRREVERLLQWTWLVAKKSVRALGRIEIEAYIAFCQNPPCRWIGLKKVPRFLDKGNAREPNPDWRPFVATVSKAAHGRGQRPQPEHYTLSQKALAGIFAITGSFYQFLIQEGYTEINPLLMIRQKSQYFQRTQVKGKIRRLSELQWHYVIETAELMAQESPQHERTLFIMTALYALYLRISELAANLRWMPKMGDFYCDADGLWWFVTVGKGNKERQITVSESMLAALRRYRRFLSLNALPSPRDQHPLIPKQIGKGPITSTSQIRVIVQSCFDRAKARLQADGFQDEAEVLSEATVHWLRHTGISDDVKHRPREHVRDDAGHSSSGITDKYIDIELRERHASGRRKRVKPV
jgi:site-specific recombinase XerD